MSTCPSHAAPIANRLYEHLRALWNWAVDQEYIAVSPFPRREKGRKDKLQHQETPRDRAIPINIKPVVREILTRRQTGTTKGPKPTMFTFEPDHYVFGNAAGGRIDDFKTAWESAVLRSHGHRVERTRGRLSTANRAKLAEIDLNFHDLRHECASRLYFDEGWTLDDVSILLGHSDVKTTERYIGADKKKRLHELVEKRALTLVRG